MAEKRKFNAVLKELGIDAPDALADHSGYFPILLVYRLRRKGYKWIRAFDASLILYCFQTSLQFLPVRESIMYEPDYVEGDVRAFIRVARRLGYGKTVLMGKADENIANKLALFFILFFVSVVALFVISQVASAIAAGYLFLSLVAVVVFSLLLYWVRGFFLFVKLKRDGYYWITMSDSRYLSSHLGKRAWSLPPRDELGTLPGFRDGDVRTMIQLAVQMYA